MKYYLIAGEASGDLHGSNLIHSLKKLDPKAEFRCLGGDLMQSEGAQLTLHFKKMAIMGIWEIIKHYKTIKKNFRICKQDIAAYKPDAIILIDYAGFNLRMAKFAKELGIKTLFYIAPKVWASRKGRIKRIKKYVDKLFVILPFEQEYFKTRNCIAEYVGNPITDAIKAYKRIPEAQFRKKNKLSDKPIIALLAGSRKTEISLCLPEMLKASISFPEYQFVVAGAPSFNPQYYEQFTLNQDIKIIFAQTYDLLSHSAAAVVTSGTATLETALFKVPEVVMYKLSTPTFIIGRPFVHIRFFSLVNIILDREVVKELLQFRLARNITRELKKILNNPDYRNTMLKNFDELASLIGEPGTSDRVAQSITNFLGK